MKNKNIHKAFLGSDLVVILAVFAVGIVFLPFGSGWLALGLGIMLCSVCMLPFYIHGYKIEGAHGVFRELNITVSRDEQDAIMSFLQGDTPTLGFQVQENGGAIVSLYYQKGSDVAYAQFYEYSYVMEGKPLPLLKITPEQKEILLHLK